MADNLKVFCMEGLCWMESLAIQTSNCTIMLFMLGMGVFYYSTFMYCTNSNF